MSRDGAHAPSLCLRVTTRIGPGCTLSLQFRPFLQHGSHYGQDVLKPLQKPLAKPMNKAIPFSNEVRLCQGQQGGRVPDHRATAGGAAGGWVRASLRGPDDRGTLGSPGAAQGPGPASTRGRVRGLEAGPPEPQPERPAAPHGPDQSQRCGLPERHREHRYGHARRPDAHADGGGLCRV